MKNESLPNTEEVVLLKYVFRFRYIVNNWMLHMEVIKVIVDQGGGGLYYRQRTIMII